PAPRPYLRRAKAWTAALLWQAVDEVALRRRSGRPRRQQVRSRADPQLREMTPGGPPLLVLGVRRSGTTLLRVMLDRHSELAVPDETYFLPQLADRHWRNLDPGRFVDDVRRVVDWDISFDEVRATLHDDMTVGQAI